MQYGSSKRLGRYLETFSIDLFYFIIFQELRRLARRYESEIDSKLSSFGKLMSVRFDANFSAKFEDEQPLINSKETFEQVALDIDSSISSVFSID